MFREGVSVACFCRCVVMSGQKLIGQKFIRQKLTGQNFTGQKPTTQNFTEQKLTTARVIVITILCNLAWYCKNESEFVSTLLGEVLTGRLHLMKFCPFTLSTSSLLLEESECLSLTRCDRFTCFASFCQFVISCGYGGNNLI